MEKYILTLFKCGEGKRDVFVCECSSTSERFIKPIRKPASATFASKNFERKNKSKEVVELQVTKGTRNLFRKLLYLSFLVKVLNLINICAGLWFDIYESPSIKDVKRKDCGDIETEREFCIGPRLKIPSNFNELLKISSFKSSFLDFLMKEYENIEYVSMIEEKEFYCSIDNKCTKFYYVEGNIKFQK